MKNNQRAIQWVANGKIGTSSKTIWAVLMGVAEPHAEDAWTRYSVPHDPADFQRCSLLLEAVPEWRARLDEVAAVFPEWGPLVENWAELEGLLAEDLPKGTAPKLYARMQELNDEGKRRAGWVENGPGSWTLPRPDEKSNTRQAGKG